MKTNPLDLYKEFFIDRDFERIGLFQLLAEQFKIERALYPGSFVHITPSFIFPETTYVDTDKRTKKFFEYSGLMDFIIQKKTYTQQPKISFYPVDYRTTINEKEMSYDLLISQYAGFVSQHCKKYLKHYGYLVSNDSHGDASMAFIDPDFELKAVLLNNKGKYKMVFENLENYFIPKKSIFITKEYLEQKQRGLGYKKTASAYLFQRIK